MPRAKMMVRVEYPGGLYVLSRQESDCREVLLGLGPHREVRLHSCGSNWLVAGPEPLVEAARAVIESCGDVRRLARAVKSAAVRVAGRRAAYCLDTTGFYGLLVSRDGEVLELVTRG